MSNTTPSQYKILIFGTFILEAAGYLAFPFISLQLRSQFNMNEVKIGQLVFIAISLRAFWSLIGSYLADKIGSTSIFILACLAESFCFFILGSSETILFASIALIIGNMGVAIWTPNIYGIVFNMFPADIVKKKIALLTAVINIGAASGAAIGGYLLKYNIGIVFYATAALYIFMIPFVGKIIPKENECKKSTRKARIIGKDRNVFSKLSFLNLHFLNLALITLMFWMSYSQFNNFFILYCNDWLNNKFFAGIAFGSVALLVAFFSFMYSKYASNKPDNTRLSVSSLIVFAFGWFISTWYPSILTASLYVLTLSLAEAILAIEIANYWNLVSGKSKVFFQGINASVRYLGMGLGGLFGGIFYVSNGELYNYGFFNIVILVVASILVIFNKGRVMV